MSVVPGHDEPLLAGEASGAASGAASGDGDGDGDGADPVLAAFFARFLSVRSLLVSCVLVIVPVVASLALSAGVPVSAPISGCRSDDAHTVDIARCIHANNNVTTISASPLFGVEQGEGQYVYSSSEDSSTALGFVFALNTISIVFMLEMYVVSFYVDSMRAYRLLAYGIFVTEVKRGMLVRMVGVVLFISIWAVVQVFVDVSTFSGLESYIYFSDVDTHGSLQPTFPDSFTSLSASNVFSKLLPVILQYSALFSFMYAHFMDIFTGVSIKPVVRPRDGVTRDGILAGLARVRWRVSSRDAADVTHSHIFESATGCSGAMWRCSRRCMSRCTQMVDYRLIRKEVGLGPRDLDAIVARLRREGLVHPLEDAE